MRRLILALAITLSVLPADGAAAPPAEAWMVGEVSPALALSDAVLADLISGTLEGSGPMGLDPQSPRFDGEWRFGTYAMAAAGHAQIGLQHPELAPLMAERAGLAVDALLADESWRFDQSVWGDLALSHLEVDTIGERRHDHAVLGYLGVALGLERRLAPDGRHAALHDAVVAALTRRLAAQHRAGIPILETYPGEGYPVDHAAVLATITLHAQATGAPEPAWLEAHLAAWSDAFLDERGLLVQIVDPTTAAPLQPGRGSGSALAAWFLGFVRPELSRQLSVAIRDELGDTIFGMGVVREYAPATCAAGHHCRGDVDSGPLIMGASISATGFSLAAARRLEDEAWLEGLWRTASTFGQPDAAGAFASGGSLGNAIMLAMLTAMPLEDAPGLLPTGGE